MNAMPKVAINKDFLSQIATLPKAIQKKARAFLEKFQADPTQPGLNFERIHQALDDKARSVRVDQNYRAIVIHPPKGDVYLVAWIDKHDEAYAWVRNRRFEVNSMTGVMQVYDAQHVAAPTSLPMPPARGKAPEPKPAGLFDAHDDEQLLLAGLPAPLLPSIRALRTDAEFDALRPHLPEDAADVLVGLASGMDLASAMADVQQAAKPKAPVDTQDFAKALANPQSQRKFHVVADDADLAAMLDQPLEQWRIFLHPTQKQLAERSVAGPMRVLGGAGTGKTVVLLHRAANLARRMRNEGRIFVTTYTKTLTGDLQDALRRLCGETLGRFEVNNLHAYATAVLRQKGIKVQVLGSDDDRRQRMERAAKAASDAKFSVDFLIEEWIEVVLPQEVVDQAGYLSARRTGRGTRLDRRQRLQVWEVLARFRQSLDRDGLMEWPQVVREARLVLEGTAKPPFAHVLADEAQDFSAPELKLLRAMVAAGPDDLFLVGDGHQRIYGQPVAMSRCGIDIVGRSRRLRLNYRTTDLIARQAARILAGLRIDDGEGGEESLQGVHSLRKGLAPSIRTFRTELEETHHVIASIKAWLASGRPAESLCVAARTNTQLRKYAEVLGNAGIPTAALKDGSSSGTEGAVHFGTFHRLKGLEFACVLLAGVQDGLVPLLAAMRGPDGAFREEKELQERCLLYVACTRARDELAICGNGRPSPLLRSAAD